MTEVLRTQTRPELFKQKIFNKQKVIIVSCYVLSSDQFGALL